MNISLCMISKDEDIFIDRCLKSVSHIVDEVILVDTGSTDKTIAIAKNYNATIINSPWRKDFSYHRNESLSYASCEWVLFLDCDEELQSSYTCDLKYILKNSNPSIMGYNLNILNIVNNTPIASFKSLRLFKNYKGFFFQNPIHEQVITSIYNKYGSTSVSDLDMSINHYGYDPAIIAFKNKSERNLEILNSIEKKDCYTYTMIGNEYLSINNFSKATDFYTLAFNLITDFHVDYIVNLIVNYISSLINLGLYEKSLEIINISKFHLPNFKDLYFLSFWTLSKLESYTLALNELDNYIYINKRVSPIIELKRFENIYNLNELKNITLSLIQK